MTIPPSVSFWIRFFPRLLVLGCTTLLSGLIPTTQAETTSYSGATAITSVPCTISSSGTYYLAQDFTLTADTAYAINITASNVTLDLNGHTLAQTSGTNNSTIGVYVGGSNVTVRNGTLMSFLEGVNSCCSDCTFENLFVLAITFYGMDLVGNDITVRSCRVNNTGGETVPNLAPYAVGIALNSGHNDRVIDCDVTTLTPGPGCYTVAILLNTCTDALVVNNRMSAATQGIYEQYSTGKYRDNLFSTSIPEPVAINQGNLIDAGNNQ